MEPSRRWRLRVDRVERFRLSLLRPPPACRNTVNLNIAVEQPDKKLALFGSNDRHLRMIRETFGVGLVGRDDEIRLSGERDPVSKAALVLEQLQKKLRRQDWLTAEDVGTAISKAQQVDESRAAGSIDVYAKGHAIKPKTEGQKRYV